MQDPKKSPKIGHLGIIAQVCQAISSQLRHVSTIGTKLVKQQYLLHMAAQYGEQRPTNGWDPSGVTCTVSVPHLVCCIGLLLLASAIDKCTCSAYTIYVPSISLWNLFVAPDTQNWVITRSFLTNITKPFTGHTECCSMLGHRHMKVTEGVTTSSESCSNYTGYQDDSEWNLSSLSWSTRHSTTWTTVSVRRLPARCHHRAPSASIIRPFQVRYQSITCTSSRLGLQAFTAARPHLWNSLSNLICPAT